MENITNLTNKDYSSYVTQAQTSNLTNQIKKSTSSEATDEEMLAACKEFEAYLVEQVYKQVQSTIKSDSDEDDNPYADYAYDLQAQQYAKLVSDQGKLGLAQQLYEGVDIKGSGTVGIITYLRTDSTRISQEADAAARECIKYK